MTVDRSSQSIAHHSRSLITVDRLIFLYTTLFIYVLLLIAATTITNIFYIIRKTEGREVAIAAIHRLLTGLRFCAVDRQIVETALGLGLKDFEDSIQLACATIDRLDAIVTRDRKDFIGSNLPIYSPTELLNQL
ncbi:PIN domain-containing protein [Microcoleus sp. CAWBG640]|uniref:PIN domain-containing protein n=1 Tax=Microcoleus sp. CAWBG640 TaxID=2841653 RepID=UPI00312B61B5